MSAQTKSFRKRINTVWNQIDWKSFTETTTSMFDRWKFVIISITVYLNYLLTNEIDLQRTIFKVLRLVSKSQSPTLIVWFRSFRNTHRCRHVGRPPAGRVIFKYGKTVNAHLVSRPTKLCAFYILLVMFVSLTWPFLNILRDEKYVLSSVNSRVLLDDKSRNCFTPSPQKTKQTLRKSIVRRVRCIFNINTQMLLLSCCISLWNTFDVEHHFNDIF